jgi:uncharacterized protein YbjT (DUF2867 family)
MRLAVITGATGFTGPYVVRELRRRFPRASLRCVVRPTSQAAALAPHDVSLAVADLRDPDALFAAFDGADTLVNVASLGFDWTDNVVRTAQRAKIKRAVFIGTTAILTGLSVASKPVRERGERLVQESGLDWTIVRPTMIYGTPADRNVARLIRLVDRSPIVPLIGPRALQQPIHVEDVATAVGSVLAHPGTVGRIYNLSGREPVTLERLAREVAAALGRRRLFVPVPVPPVIAILSVISLVMRPPISVEQVRRVQEDKSFDHSEAARDFGFLPRDFKTGVASEVALYRAGM